MMRGKTRVQGNREQVCHRSRVNLSAVITTIV